MGSVMVYRHLAKWSHSTRMVVLPLLMVVKGPTKSTHYIPRPTTLETISVSSTGCSAMFGSPAHLTCANQPPRFQAHTGSVPIQLDVSESPGATSMVHPVGLIDDQCPRGYGHNSVHSALPFLTTRTRSMESFTRTLGISSLDY